MRRVRALLDAQLYLPSLVDRLSGGYLTIDEATACRWAGWIDSLRRDPAWKIIEPALEMREAWPAVWQDARQAGFSPATQHHQAIFFTRLFERTAADSRFELARLSFERALDCWKALEDDDHLRREVLPTVASDLPEADADEVLASLFDGPLQLLEERALKALRVHDWTASPRRRPLLFCLDLLDHARQTFADGPDDALSQGIVDGAREVEMRLHRAVTDELDQRLKSLDYATVELDELLAIFDGAILRCRHLRFPPPLDRLLLRSGLAVIWDLRETKRDEELGIIAPMVERLEPCTDRLRQLGGEDTFGLQGALADLQVFKGEDALAIDARQEAFEEALQICPGHRNASRLLSYLLLERANRDLLKTAAIPGATSRVDILRRRIEPLLDNAADHIERAEELYPENDLLDRYRDDLREEQRRFRLTMEADSED